MAVPAANTVSIGFPSYVRALTMWTVIAIPEADFLKMLNARLMIWEQC